MKFSISSYPFKKLVAVAAALIVLPVAVACDSNVSETVETTEVPEDTEVAADAAAETIVDVAAANGSFDTLVTAIQAADLVGTLSSEGPFTVFAPTDEAFAALPEGVLETLLQPENEAALTQILTYHVVPAAVPASAVETGDVSTVAGEELDVVADESGVTVNGASVVMTDITASNGIIHVIDAVLLPPSLDLSAL